MTQDIIDSLRTSYCPSRALCFDAADEIQRLRAALMAIGAWKHPDQPEHPLQRMAREALVDERRDSDMIGQFGE